MESATVSSINVADPQTWDGNVFLRFDVDWASDGVLEDTINLDALARAVDKYKSNT